MKTNFTFFCLLALLFNFFIADAQNIVINGGFETYTQSNDGEKPFQAPTYVPGWIQAHGTPQHGNPGQPFLPGYPHSGNCYAFMLTTTVIGGNTFLEGLYQDLQTSLQGGKAYQVSFWAGSSGLNLEAVNGLQPYIGSTYTGSLPNIPSEERQLVYYGAPSYSQQTSMVFYPKKNFSQIWFHGNDDGPYSDNYIDDVAITEVKPINQLSGTIGFLCGSTQFQMPLSSSYYNWSIPTGNASISGSGNTVTVTPTGNGNINICVSVDNGQTYCITVWSGPPSLDNVYVDNNLNPGPVAVNSNTTHYIASSSPNAIAYSITSSTTFGDISLNLTGVNNGNCQINVGGAFGSGKVSITVSNPCNGSYTRDIIFYIPSGYRMYSNPVKDKVTVEFTDTQLKEALPDLLEIVSEKSQKVVKYVDVQKIYELKSFVDQNKIIIDVHDFPNGIYYLRITNLRLSKEDHVKTLRLIIDN